MNTKVLESFSKLQKYCEAEEFKGYDPYDGLNSRLFKSLPFISKSRLARLAWIQVFKRSPLNLRAVTGVKKDHNPKALGLFLSGYCALYKKEPKPEDLGMINFFISLIYKKMVPGWSGSCWGYNFDWQARAFFQPKNTPNVVVSTFVANALLDAYEISGDKELLKTCRSTCDFLLHDLNRNYNTSGQFCFSYSPLDKAVVFNASLLASRLLARVYSFTKEELLISAAKQSVAYCCNYQHEDGSWSYGTLPFHRWIDNFHTGYNLECISDYIKFSGDPSYNVHMEKGFEYYINTFFTEEGVPKYYNTSTYPIDIHSPAQLIITLIHLNKLKEYKSTADKVLLWTIEHMQDRKGFFYYQINKRFFSKISYIRWAQGWMYYSMANYLSFIPTHSESQSL